MGQLNHEDLTPEISKILKDSDGLKQTTNNHINNAEVHLREGDRAKWNAGYDTYLRYAGNCTVITDWNLATQNGMYMGSGVLNAPDATWYMGTVTAHNDKWIQQKVVAFSDTQNEFQRFKIDGVWSAWELVYQRGDKTKLDLTRSFRTDGDSNSDPNTNGQEFFLTNHASVQNAGESGVYWYIQQGYWTGTNNRYQIATKYNSIGDMKTRNCYDSTWSAWSPSLQSLFNSVSNGKSLIANAITQIGTSTSATAEFATMANNITSTVNTGKTQIANAIINKGVSASASSSFATLASNIGAISTGKKQAVGTFPIYISPYSDTSYTVSNLAFAPQNASHQFGGGVLIRGFNMGFGFGNTGGAAVLSINTTSNSVTFNFRNSNPNPVNNSASTYFISE